MKEKNIYIYIYIYIYVFIVFFLVPSNAIHVLRILRLSCFWLSLFLSLRRVCSFHGQG